MEVKTLLVKARINKANNQINVNIPRKKLSIEELDSIQKNKSIRILFKDE